MRNANLTVSPEAVVLYVVYCFITVTEGLVLQQFLPELLADAQNMNDI